MNLDRFLNLLAAVFGALGSIYVLKGLVVLSPDLMAHLSRTKFDFNEQQIDALAGQKADSIVGVVFVLIAFLLAAINLAFVLEGTHVFDRLGAALAIIAAIAGVSYIGLERISTAIKRNQKRAIGRIITADYLGAILEGKQLRIFHVPDLKVYARTLLDMRVEDTEPPRLLLKRLAEAVGKQVPADFDFSEVEKQ